MFTFSDVRTDELIRVLRAHPDGADLIDIACKLTPSPPRRTLQRWLAKLVAAGQIKRRGGSKNTRYFAGNGRVALPVKKRRPKQPTAPVPVPPPAPVAPASRLPPRFRPLFDRIAPKIIRMALDADVAIGMLAEAAIGEFGADTDTMNAFATAGMAELDVLDRDATLQKYNLRRSIWDDWRRKWCDCRGLPPDAP